MTTLTLLSPLLTYCADLPGFSPNAVEVAETEQRIGTMLSTLHHWERSAVEWRERAEGLHARVAELEARIAELQPMAECATIMAVCGYFSRMRGPDAWLDHGSWDEYPELFACAGVDLRSFQHGTRFYAGSAPVPAAQAVDVDAICNAYESGVGHRGRPTANVNPYRECTPEHEAYAIGAKGEAAQAEENVADDELRQAIARAYCNPMNASKIVDPDLIEAATAEVSNMLAAKAKGES